jgi:hypothetical protein
MPYDDLPNDGWGEPEGNGAVVVTIVLTSIFSFVAGFILGVIL